MLSKTASGVSFIKISNLHLKTLLCELYIKVTRLNSRGQGSSVLSMGKALGKFEGKWHHFLRWSESGYRFVYFNFNKRSVYIITIPYVLYIHAIFHHTIVLWQYNFRDLQISRLISIRWKSSFLRRIKWWRIKWNATTSKHSVSWKWY